MNTVRNKKGSLYTLSLIFAVVLLFASASLMQFQSLYLKMNLKNLDRNKALYKAESAIELAKWQIKNYGVSNFNTLGPLASSWTKPSSQPTSGTLWVYTDSTDNEVYKVIVNS